MTRSFTAEVGSQTISLPIVPVDEQLSVALMIVFDHGVKFIEAAGVELAEHFRDAHPQVVVAPATLGVPVAIEVARALGLDDYVVLHKSKKIHLKDALSEPVHAITSTEGGSLFLDRQRVPAVQGRRTLLVDDVISTGSSIRASLRLLERAGAEVVGVGALLSEGDGGRDVLEPYRDRIHTLGHLPLFAS